MHYFYFRGIIKNKVLLKSYFKENTIEAGCDEAGRGCLAGPVVAAAVILPADYKNSLLDDSKRLTEKARYRLKIEIEKESVSYSVAYIDNLEIDKINILKASIKAMHVAIGKLNKEPEHIIVDGNRFYPFGKTPHTCIVKGDSKFLSIAAASVLAKTYRDEYMTELDKRFAKYGWKQNKGYPTKKHREAIAQYGITEYHRRSFQLLDRQLEINF